MPRDARFPARHWTVPPAAFLVARRAADLAGSLAGDLVDLVLGRGCLACSAPGPSLCAGCLAGLRGPAIAAGPTDPDARCPGFAATRYDGIPRSVILAYKQQGDRSLADPLGRLLADAVAALGPPGSPSAPRMLVPVPAHRRSRRGFDAVGAIAAAAARHLAREGRPARVAPLLASGRRYPALKDLSRHERRRHVQGAFRARSVTTVRSVVVVDDVLTTGVTLGEALRALAAAGMRVEGFATVAVAERRAQPLRPLRQPG